MNARQAIQAELSEFKDRRRKRAEQFKRLDREDADKIAALEKALSVIQGRRTRNGGKRRERNGKPVPVHETQARILEYLEQHDGIGLQTDVGKALGLPSSTMTYAIASCGRNGQKPLVEGRVNRERVKISDYGGGRGWGWLLMLRGSAREAVTRPGEGVREGRLRDSARAG